jgi:hypothetical protein
VCEVSRVETTGRGPDKQSTMAVLRSTVDTATNKATVEEWIIDLRSTKDEVVEATSTEWWYTRQTQSTFFPSQINQPADTADEESSSADAFLIAKIPSGAFRSKHLLATIFHSTRYSNRPPAKVTVTMIFESEKI